MKSEKGSITVYVLLAMLTFTAFLMAVYVRSSNTEMAQMQATEQIKEIYEDYNIDEVYETIKDQTPEILGYKIEGEELTIKTLNENGINIDQNGKEILYYAATDRSIAPTYVSDINGKFGVWQKSKIINLTGDEEEIYIWIKNEDGKISNILECSIDN